MAITPLPTTAVAESTDPRWRGASRWILMLMVAATSTWRPQVFYEGGLDPIVAAKALIVAATVGMAFFARSQRSDGRPLGNALVWMMVTYLVVATFGGWVAGDLKVDLVLGARVLMLGATVVLMVKTWPAARLIRDLVAVLALVAVVAVVTGLPAMVTSGERLRGGFPPLHPNELAFVCAVPAIGITHLLVHHETRIRHVALLGLLLAGLWLSGSRTSLMGVLIAMAIIVVQARVLKRWLAICLVAMIPILTWVALGTSVLAEFVNRGGQGRITTLNSRSIAWAAAWDYPATEFNRWFGSGLSIKLIPVAGQYWDDQALDSSWVSTFIQVGWIGIGLLVVWWLIATIGTFSLPLELRPVVQGMLAYILIRSLLENGLIDSSPMFVAFLMLTLVTTRRGLATELETVAHLDPAAVSRPGDPASERSRSGGSRATTPG